MIEALDHVNISTDDLEKCRRFYCDVLGLEVGPRPTSARAGFGRPGLWLCVKGKPVVHVIKNDTTPGQKTGSFDHFAFQAHAFDTFAARLRRFGIPFRENDVPELEMYQVFLEDPHGIRIEVNFVGMDRPLRILREEGKLSEQA